MRDSCLVDSEKGQGLHVVNPHRMRACIKQVTVTLLTRPQAILSLAAGGHVNDRTYQTFRSVAVCIPLN